MPENTPKFFMNYNALEVDIHFKEFYKRYKSGRLFMHALSKATNTVSTIKNNTFPN